MTRLQKYILICTSLTVAVFLHTFLCDWQLASYSESQAGWYATFLIVPMGSGTGILARSPETLTMDGLLGVAAPLMLVGLSLFVAAIRARHEPDQDS